jgi:hypothetical protein
MRILEAIAIGLVICLAILISVFARREYFSRSKGTVELYVRLFQRPGGRGWAPGFAHFRGDDLRWYRLFSLAFRPKRTMNRRKLSVESRRSPTPDEAQLLPVEWVVLQCQADGEHLEIAMPRHTVTGFLSWLESVTPYST